MAEDLSIRAFLAVPLTRYFDIDVAPLINTLKNEYPHVRWVSPEQIHITLHFFGSIPMDDFQRISRIVNPLVADTSPFAITLEGLGAFPAIDRPSVIWIGVGGETDLLTQLQQRLEGQFLGAGFPCEDRSFKPHLTIGRVKEAKREMRLGNHKFGPTQAKRIEEILLLRSHLTPGGASYETMQTYSLSKT